MLALLTRLYHRHKRMYPAIVVATVFIEIEFAAVVSMYVGGMRYTGLSGWRATTQLLWFQIPLVMVTGFGFFVSRRDFRLVVSWLRGTDHDALAVATAGQGLSRIVNNLALTFLLLVQPIGALLLLLPTHHVTAARFFPLFALGTTGMVYGILMVMLTIEASIRPGLAELAAIDPSVNRILRPPARLGLRLFAGLFAACGMTGAFVGGVTEQPGNGAGRVLIATLVDLPVVAAFLVPLASMVLDPVRALVAGTSSVAKGDLHAFVPMLSFDELGVLSDSFNGMVGGLRERESLRGRNRELNSALQASRTRIVATADAERRRLERDIHDGAQQSLVTMNLKLGLLERKLADDPAGARAAIEELRGDAKRALAELRDLAHGIYPALLENEGLVVALEDAGRRVTGVSVEVVGEQGERYSREIEAAVYFCCLEALQNASKHAGPDATVTLTVSPLRDRLDFSVRDNGPGFNSRTTRSHGLDNMSDRIGAVGGELVIQSSPGSGTTVHGWVPRTLVEQPA